MAKTKKGVKKGAVRGPYKKNKPAAAPKKAAAKKQPTKTKIENEEIKNEVQSQRLDAVSENTNDNVLSGGNVDPISTDSGTVKEPVVTEAEVIEEEQGESKHNDFIADNATPDNFIEDTDDDEDEYEEEQQEKDGDEYTEDKTTFKAGVRKLINGRMLLAFCDAIIPAGVLRLMKWIKKDDPRYNDIKSKDLKLTPDQREDMEPLADEVAKVIFDQVDPMTAFFIMYGVNVWSNLQDAL